MTATGWGSLMKAFLAGGRPGLQALKPAPSGRSGDQSSRDRAAKGVRDYPCTSSHSLTPEKPRSVKGMDNQTEVSEFLRTRRARVTPEQAGLVTGGRRRVSGLRREEVAMLASVSTDYYAKMERGNLTGVSPEILDSVARALRLDEAETEHLQDLARTATPALSRGALVLATAPCGRRCSASSTPSPAPPPT